MTKHKYCRWCDAMLFKSRKHTCPAIFLHKVTNNEITIRGRHLDVHWVNGSIVVEEEKK